jgi:hypothetical protein
MMRGKNILVLISAVACATSCGSPDHLSLDESTDDIADRMHRLQAIRVLNDSTDPPTESELSNAQLTSALTTACRAELAPTTCAGSTTGIACGNALCTTTVSLCVAHRLLEIAGLTVTSTTLTLSSGTVTIPPQSAATNSALAVLARTQASDAARQAYDGFTALVAIGGVCTSTDLATHVPNAAGPTRASVYAVTFVESYHVYQEATQEAVDNRIAVADSHYSTERSLEHGADLAFTAPDLSRAGAAQLLVSGTFFIPGNGNRAYCRSPDPTPQITAAEQVFRDAGVAPADLRDPTVTIESLLAGTIANGSVRQRLANIYGSGPLAASTTSSDVLSIFNLSLADFVAARQELADEIPAFGRSYTQLMDGEPLAGGAPRTFRRFASTAIPPTPADPAYYAALARFNYLSAPGAAYLDGTGMPSWTRATDASRFVDAVVTRATRLRNVANAIPAGIRDDVLRPIDVFLPDALDSRPARARLCLTPAGARTTVDITVQGIRAGSGVILVRGEEGLECGTRGAIEGQACSITPWTITRVDTTPTALPAQGFISAASGSAMVMLGSPVAGAPPPFERFYLLRKVSTTRYEVVTEFGLPITGTAFCIDQPIVPSAEARVGEILAPSTDLCALPSVSCAGAQFDERLPLEDELGSDATTGESSWRHYLELASAAAQQSDTLANQVIEQGLALDQHAEAALDRLQTICGANVDVDGLVTTDLAGLRPTPLVACTSNVQCTGPGNRCLAGSCGIDPVALAEDNATAPNRNRLAECLGDDSSVEFVTLGTRPVCLWVSQADRNQVCPGQDLTHPCPILAPTDSTGAFSCATMAVPTAGGPFERLLVTQTLDYFDTDQTLVAGSEHPPCDAVRRLRNWESYPAAERETRRAADLAEVVSSDFFRPLHAAQLATRVSWEARLGAYSAVLVDNAEIFATGRTIHGVDPATTATWPCATGTAIAGCSSSPSGERSLFCNHVDCRDLDARARMNDRLFHATLGLHVGMGAPNGHYMTIPFRPLGPIGGGTGGDSILNGYSPSESDDGVYGPGHTPFSSATYRSPVTLSFDDEELFHSATWWYAPTRVVAWRGPLSEGGATLASYTADEYAGGYLAAPGTEMFATGEFVIDSAGAVGSGLVGLSQTSPAAPGREGWFYRSLAGGSGSVSIGSTHGTASSGVIDFDNPYVTDLTAYTAEVPPYVYSPQSLLDGLELACEVGRHTAETECDLRTPPRIDTVDDLQNGAHFIRCVAREIQRRGALTVFAHVPSRAIDALRRQSSSGAFPATGGEYSGQLSTLRGALVDVSQTSPLIAGELNHLAADLEFLREGEALADVRRRLAETHFMASMSSQMAACASPIGELNPTAMVSCVNAAAQIAFAASIRDGETEEAHISGEMARTEFFDRWASRGTNMQSLAARLATASENIDGALSSIDGLRSEGRRELSRALFLNSDAVGRTWSLGSSMRRRYNLTLSRYEAAHQSAIRLTFLARRAIEQRLGVRLSDLRDDLPLVDAPSTWEGTLCTSTGVDYRALHDSAFPVSFADAYVGDYVARLQNVVESYRLAYAFHEGSDVAVVSLRDDVMGVRATCSAQVNNFLLHSANLHAAGGGGGAGWLIHGCPQATPPDLPGSCISLETTDAHAVPAADPAYGDASGFAIHFGRNDGGTCDAASNCVFAPGAWYGQTTDTLPRGRYRMSWYGRPGTSSPTRVDPAQAVAVVASSGTIATSAVRTLTGTSGWNRYYLIFDIASDTSVDVRFRPPVVAAGGSYVVEVAAAMLERLDNLPGPLAEIAAEALAAPGLFVTTDSSRTRDLPVCEDTDGAVFRETRWHRACARLCPDGFRESCDGSIAQSYCYWETRFQVNQRDIDRGAMFQQSGFARGNFNYRITSIGLNFVGTGVRDCSRDPSPSTCYAAGFVPYSLVHVGPFTVRNHFGADAPVALFDGHIEHARGLASERYVTNPLSSADRAMMADYMRGEWIGRPLDGGFVVRVWEEPGVDFNAIEDVQFVINYEYWTRLE